MLAALMKYQMRAFSAAVLALATVGLYAFLFAAGEPKLLALKVLGIGACALISWAVMLILFWNRPAE